jgi:hypothetical protein
MDSLEDLDVVVAASDDCSLYAFGLRLELAKLAR